MKGPSAYCGGLWLAALSVAVEMATENGEEDKAKEWNEALEKARAAYHEKLWNEEDKFFKFDVTEKGKSRRSCYTSTKFGDSTTIHSRALI